MQLHHYEVAGIRSKGQNGEGFPSVFFSCWAYSDQQALGWAEQKAQGFLHSLRIVEKVAVDG